MNQFTVPAEMIQQTLNYLGTKPYNEVAGLVSQYIQLINSQTQAAQQIAAANQAVQKPLNESAGTAGKE